MKTRKLIGLLAVLAAICFCFGIVACGGEKPDGPNDPTPTEKHECETKCPVCGLCIDLECEGCEDYEKCGDSAFYNAIFEAVDLKVAKSNCTTNAAGRYVEDFNATNGSSIVFRVNASEAATVSLIAYVAKTAESGVYTESAEVTVNGVKVTSKATVPALTASESAVNSWAKVGLGCVDLNEGDNDIVFTALGDGVKSHNFQKIELLGDLDFTLSQATATVHTCTSVCETCGGCLNFSCLNEGCAEKCTCVSGGKHAKIFWVCDERVKTNRDVNPELDGIGCTWGKATRVEYPVYAEEDMTITYGAVISVMNRCTLPFTDQFNVYVDGVKQPAGSGYCPTYYEEDPIKVTAPFTVTDEMKANDGMGRQWNVYKLTVVGELTLKQGANIICVEQDLTDRAGSAWVFSYNFQSLVLFTEKNVDWFVSEHHLEYHAPEDATCKDAGKKEYWSCTDADCGKLFSDQNGMHEVDENDLIIPADATAHEWEREDETHVKCSVCDKTASLFEVYDSRLETSRKPKDGEGIGGSWDKETKFTYYIEADRAGKANLFASISQNKKALVFTDYFTVTLNGQKLSYDVRIPQHSSTVYTVFDTLYLGEVDLIEGLNVLTISYTPVKATNGASYNFRDVIFETDLTLEWHTCHHVCLICGRCTDQDCTTAYVCRDKCLGHENADVETAGISVTLGEKKTYTFQPDQMYNIGQLKEPVSTLFYDDNTGRGIMGSVLEAGKKITLTMTVPEDLVSVLVHLRPYFSLDAEVAAQFGEKGASYNIGEYLSFTLDGTAVETIGTHSALTDSGAGWTAVGYVEVGGEAAGDGVTLTAGDHTLVIEVLKAGAPNINEFRFVVSEVTPKVHVHEGVLSEAFEGNCVEQGRIQYYRCECGLFFSDQECQEQIDEDTLFTGVNPDNHKHVIAEDEGVTVICEYCREVLYYAFDAYDFRGTTTELDKTGYGVASRWDQEAKWTIKIYATEGGEADLSMFMNKNKKAILFTEVVTITINGVKAEPTDGEVMETGSGWAPNYVAKIGKVTLAQGVNTIELSYTPKKDTEGGLGLTYNLLELRIAGEGKYSYDECLYCKKCLHDCEGEDQCTCGKTFTFDAMSDNVTNELISGDTATPAAKNEKEACIGGSNGKTNRITFYIYSDRATTAKLYTNVSAMGSSDKIDYDATWTMTLNGEAFTAEEDIVHHNVNDYSGRVRTDMSRFYLYEYEYVNEISLKEGLNTIVFTSTGSNALNFRDLAFAGLAEGTTLRFVTAQEIGG